MSNERENPVELVPAEDSGPARRVVDHRRRVPEPPPVRLVAVKDVLLKAPAESAGRLDAFYVGLLRFERDRHEEAGVRAYRAENFRLVCELIEAGAVAGREDYRRVGVELPSLADAELRLIEAELEYARQKSVMTGLESIVLLDPAGNWVELFERRELR